MTTRELPGAVHPELHGFPSASDRPLVEIRPTRGWVSLRLRDLWEYRELLGFLAWRDVQVRYKQTFLGVAWAVLQPLLTMATFTVLFGRMAGMPSDGIPYPLFAFAGLLPWTFFANAVSASGNSLVGSAGLITKVYFPRMIIPGAAVAAGLVDFAIGSVVLAVLMASYGVGLTWRLSLFPVLVLLTTLLALGVGLLTSAMNVRYRDIRHALPFLIQLWMFATPIIYPLSLVSPRWRAVLALNPLTGLVEGMRSSLFGRPFDLPSLAISTAMAVVLLVGASYTFRRMESRFADTI